MFFLALLAFSFHIPKQLIPAILEHFGVASVTHPGLNTLGLPVVCVSFWDYSPVATLVHVPKAPMHKHYFSHTWEREIGLSW